MPTLYILIEATTAPKAAWRGGSGAEASFATSSMFNRAPIAVFMACDEMSAGESRETPPCIVPGCVPSSCGSGGETRPRRFTVFLVFLHIFMPGTSLDDLSKITERGARGLVRAGREGVRCRGEVSEGVQRRIRVVDDACGRGVVALYTRSRAGWTRDARAFVSKTVGATRSKVATLSKGGRSAGERTGWEAEGEIVCLHVCLKQEVRAPCIHSYTIKDWLLREYRLK